jgi:hypothetical protein
VEAAEAVCDEPMALDALAQLRECSLVQTEERPDWIRFRMLETLREFGGEHLTGEERAETEGRSTLAKVLERLPATEADPGPRPLRARALAAAGALAHDQTPAGRRAVSPPRSASSASSAAARPPSSMPSERSALRRRRRKVARSIWRRRSKKPGAEHGDLGPRWPG